MQQDERERVIFFPSIAGTLLRALRVLGGGPWKQNRVRLGEPVDVVPTVQTGGAAAAFSPEVGLPGEKSPRLEVDEVATAKGGCLRENGTSVSENRGGCASNTPFSLTLVRLTRQPLTFKYKYSIPDLFDSATTRKVSVCLTTFNEERRRRAQGAAADGTRVRMSKNLFLLS